MTFEIEHDITDMEIESLGKGVAVTGHAVLAADGDGQFFVKDIKIEGGIWLPAWTTAAGQSLPQLLRRVIEEQLYRDIRLLSWFIDRYDDYRAGIREAA